MTCEQIAFWVGATFVALFVLWLISLLFRSRRNNSNSAGDLLGDIADGIADAID